mmetsp:Transcript_535/g.1714  ORF Transcript_535/g.1714 Transcript_535/m.1714 type:complete len:560 (+) Transcript_535:370-2049(+)
MGLGFSEGEDVVIRVAQLVEVGDTGLFLHDRGPAHDCDGVGRRREQVLPQHLRRNETDVEAPALVALSQTVHCVPELKAVGVVCRELLQLLPGQDVGGRAIGIEQLHLRPVLGIAEHGIGNLVARGEPGAAGDHGDPAAAVGLPVVCELPSAQVHELAQRALHVDRVADLHGVQVLRHLAALGEGGVLTGGVNLDQEVHVAQGLVVCHGRVGPHHRLILDAGLEEHVHACGQAQPRRGRRQAEAEDARVLGHDDLLHQRQLLHLAWVQEGGRAGLRGGLGRSRPGRRGRRGCRGAQRPDIVVLELLPRLLGVDRLEVFRGLLAGREEDARRAAWVAGEEGRAVIDLALNDNPGATLVVVALHLLHGHALLQPRSRRGHELAGAPGCSRGTFCRGHARSHDPGRGRPRCRGRGGGRGRGTSRVRIQRLVVPDGGNGQVRRNASAARRSLRRLCLVEVAGGLCHPAACLGAGLRGVLEPERVTAVRVHEPVHLDAEDGVAEHAHDVPGEVHRLRVLVGVEGAAPDLRAVAQPSGIHLGFPPGPAPVLVRATGSRDLVLRAV